MFQALSNRKSVSFLKFILAVALAAPATALPAEPGIPFFPIPETELTLHAEPAPGRFISAHGRRGMVLGYAGKSLEGWVYPFRIFHDFRPAFRAEGDSLSTPGSALVRQVIVNPESVTRVYSAQDFTVKETVFVPLDLAGFEILYEVQNHRPLHIELSFQPDLNLMWPGGIGGQSYDWDAKRHAFVLQDSSAKYSALVGSPAAVRHSAPAAYTQPWNADRRLSLELDIPAGLGQTCLHPLVVACTIPDHYEGGKLMNDFFRILPACTRKPLSTTAN